MTSSVSRVETLRLVRALVAIVLLGLGMGAQAGSDPSVAGDILVRLKTADALARLLVKHQLVQVDRFGARPIFRLGVIGNASVADKIAALQLEPTVLDAEPNFLHAAPEARKNNAWAIGSATAYTAQWMPDAIHLPAAQRLSIGTGVRIAVLDTGVDTTHPALQGRLLQGYDFVDDDGDPTETGSTLNAAFGHGTHVAGLIVLIAPDARIVPLRVLDAEGRGNAWVLAQAMLRAVDPDGDPSTDDGAHVINLSLGSLSRTHIMDTIARIVSCSLIDPEGPAKEFDDPGYNDDRQRCSVSRGAVVVAAAGNDASRSEREYPAAEGAYGLIPVAATTAAGRIADFSNSGSWINVAAPGDGITSTIPGGAFGTWSGTSMAAPVVAGTAALVRALNPALSPEAIVKRLERFSSSLCGASQRQVDAEAALTGAAPAAPSCR